MALMGISGRQLAKLAGMGESGIRKAQASGRIEKLADGSYDSADCLQRLTKNTDPSRAKVRAPVEDRAPIGAQVRKQSTLAPAKPEGPDFNSARTADTLLKTQEREIKLARLRKELVPVDAVKAHVAKSFKSICQVFQRLPTRHVPEMAAALGCDPGALDALLRKAIAAELNELSAPVVRA